MTTAASNGRKPAVSERSDGEATLGRVRARWVWVTPELATLWLARNTRNRHMMPTLVEKYAGDILAGYWQISHEGVAFADDGTLADGQHRLAAIAKTGASLWMLVVEGLPGSVIEVINRGKIRNLAHTLQILGYSRASNRSVAVARGMMDGPVRAGTGRNTWTDSVVKAFIDAAGEAVLFACEAMPKSLASAAVAAVIGRAYYHADTEQLRRFAVAMKDEIPREELRPGDRSARLLKTWLDSLPGIGGGPIRGAMYRKAQRALAAYLDGVDLEKLYETAEDVFPLPPEVIPKRIPA